jgi:hypothetical protein
LYGCQVCSNAYIPNSVKCLVDFYLCRGIECALPNSRDKLLRALFAQCDAPRKLPGKVPYAASYRFFAGAECQAHAAFERRLFCGWSGKAKERAHALSSYRTSRAKDWAKERSTRKLTGNKLPNNPANSAGLPAKYLLHACCGKELREH